MEANTLRYISGPFLRKTVGKSREREFERVTGVGYFKNKRKRENAEKQALSEPIFKASKIQTKRNLNDQSMPYEWTSPSALAESAHCMCT